jgi:hypothetical protein
VRPRLSCVATGPSSEQGRLERLLRGDPPVAEPADMLSRYGFVAAAALGFVAIVGGGTGLVDQMLGLLVPAGLLLAAIGLMRVTNYHGVRDRDRLREEHGLMFRLTENRNATAFGGAILTVIGVGWCVLGISAL